MPTGKIQKWFAEKDFGFLKPDDGTNGGNGVFAHKSYFRGDPAMIVEGASVTFDVEVEAKTNKPKATNWLVVAGALPAVPDLTALASLGAGGFGPALGMSMPLLGASPYGLPTLPLISTAGLPVGWESTTDPATGRPYYFNRATGETSWTPPAATAAATALPAVGSLSAVDLGATAGADAVAAAAAAAAGLLVAGDAGATATAPLAALPAAALPAGWESTIDPATGKTYYFNRATNETTWTMPTA